MRQGDDLVPDAGEQRTVRRILDLRGAGMSPDLRTELAKGCDHAGGHDSDRCDAFYPQLAAVTSS